MTTNRDSSESSLPTPDTREFLRGISARSWQEFHFRSYAHICAVKHGMVVPENDVEDLSDEELESRIRVLEDLARTPPR